MDGDGTRSLLSCSAVHNVYARIAHRDAQPSSEVEVDGKLYPVDGHQRPRCSQAQTQHSRKCPEVRNDLHVSLVRRLSSLSAACLYLCERRYLAVVGFLLSSWLVQVGLVSTPYQRSFIFTPSVS